MAVIVDGRQQALVRLVVVAEDGHASTARADELDLYGVIEDNYADPQTEPPSAHLVRGVNVGARYYKLREQWSDRAVEWWFIKIVDGENGPVFDAYVGVDRRGRVVERSSAYGVFEGDAGDFAEDSEAAQSDTEAFAAAWHAPRAPRSWRRRFLQRLSGVDDTRDPT